MKALFSIVITFFILSTSGYSQSYITVSDSARISASQIHTLKLFGIKGMNVKIKGSDTNQIYYRYKIEAKKSALDNDFGGGKIQSDDNEGVLSLYFINQQLQQSNQKTTWIKQLLKGNNSTTKSTIYKAEMEITMPKSIALDVVSRYSDLTIESLNRPIIIENRSGSLIIKNINANAEVRSDYSNIQALNINGDLEIHSKSAEIRIQDIAQNTIIRSDYAKIEALNLNGNLTTYIKSGTIDLTTINGNYTHRGDYTGITANTISGSVDIFNKSGKVTINSMAGGSISGDYANITIERIGKEGLDIKSKSSEIKLRQTEGDVTVDGNYLTLDLGSILGNLKVYNKSGTLEVNGIAGNIELDGSSEIKLNNVSSQNITISNRNEDIKIDMADLPKTMSINSEYGDVVLSAEKWIDTAFDLRTRDDVIEHIFSKSQIIRSINTNQDYSIEAVIGNKQNQVKVVNRSGKIKIKEEKK